MLKKICLADTIRAVTAAMAMDPLPSIEMLTNCTVPLNMMSPDANAQIGPNPFFCMRSPYPIPRTTNVTIIGSDVLKAALKSALVILPKCLPPHKSTTKRDRESPPVSLLLSLKPYYTIFLLTPF